MTATTLFTRKRAQLALASAGVLVTVSAGTASASGWQATVPSAGSASAAAKADTLGTPSALTATGQQCGQASRYIQLSWGSGSGTVPTPGGHVLVSRQTTSTGFTQVQSLAATATSWQDTSIVSGTTYYFAIRYSWGTSWVGAIATASGVKCGN